MKTGELINGGELPEWHKWIGIHYLTFEVPYNHSVNGEMIYKFPTHRCFIYWLN